LLSCRNEYEKVSSFVGIGLWRLGYSIAVAAPKPAVYDVSYDPTRELYQDFNVAFAKHWKARRPKW